VPDGWVVVGLGSVGVGLGGCVVGVVGCGPSWSMQYPAGSRQWNLGAVLQSASVLHLPDARVVVVGGCVVGVVDARQQHHWSPGHTPISPPIAYGGLNETTL
jgi:hypothetical protein